jgi:hypothetical protein
MLEAAAPTPASLIHIYIYIPFPFIPPTTSKTQAATLDPNTAVDLHRILEPNATEYSGTNEVMLSTITERDSTTRKVAPVAARKPKRLHKYQRISDTTASLHLDLPRGSDSILNVTTYAAKEQLGKVAFTELWHVKQGAKIAGLIFLKESHQPAIFSSRACRF